MYLRTSITQLMGLVVILCLPVFKYGNRVDAFMQADDQNQSNLTQFDMLTIESGWVLLDEHLFWTSDAGKTWTEIGPSLPSDAIIQDVVFIDANTGWLLWATININGSANFYLALTHDHGITWDVHSLSLFEEGDISVQIEKADMGWSDSQTGWIAIKQSSGSNFSLGTLFTTSDGGESWVGSTLPMADHVTFSDSQIGWSVGGPAGDQIFKTQNFGLTWQEVRPDLPRNSQATAYSPFYSNGHGIFVMTVLGLRNSLDVYTLDQLSDNWLPSEQVTLTVQPGAIGLSILDSQNFVAVIPGSESIVQLKNGELTILDNKDGFSRSIVELDMVSLDNGWARSVESSCVTDTSLDDGTTAVSCTSLTRLLQTENGGITWQEVQLPYDRSIANLSSASASDRSLAVNVISNLGNTDILIGQGFDKCEIPTPSQMQTWAESSPFQAVNLYIGGSNRACSNSALSVTYLNQLYQQGWRFIPTWVGPQAPCTGYLSRMSSDPVAAYDQGVVQADLAVEQLALLGLTYPDKTGSVVYYDIEYYGSNTACRDAVNAFMDGWVSQLHVRGNLAGVYGSTLCNTGLSDFLSIASVPDVVWPARWYHNLGEGFYDPTAAVWNLGSCISNTVWADHQRIRQYEGEHDESWGNLTLGVDNNVLDGVVAIPFMNPTKISFQEVASGMSNPVFITHAGDGSGRIFVVERSGRIRIIKNGTMLSTPFLDIQSIVKSTNSEQGLLGLAFNPSYRSSGKFYVVYTAPRSGDSNGSILTLRQYTVSSGNPDVANINSGTNILTIDHPTYINHNGGTIAFGNDGYLYWSTGDGGGGGDPNNNAQDLTKFLGKILRIDVNSGSPYSIPVSNPFYGSSNPSIKKEIWSYGLRNPWRMSFDRLTQDLYIGDVGQSTREEIDFQSANSSGGENYGWNIMEGSFCYNAASCDTSDKVLPVAEYTHALGCSVTGGHIYRGTNFPSLYGYYLYGDFCSGKMFGLRNNSGWESVELKDTPYSISTFGEDEQGELYLADYATGKIYRISYQESIHNIKGNAGVAGVVLDYNDGTVVSQVDGNYSLSVPNGWSGNVTPTHPCFSFNPTSRNYNNVTTNYTDQDYAANEKPNRVCVLNILRSGFNPTGTSNVDFNVTFTESVTGVDLTDFTLYTTGVTGASITNVSGSGNTRTVTVNTGSGNGTIRLDVVDDDSIQDIANNPLGGAGAGNGDFKSGEIFIIQKTGNLIPTTLNFGDQLFRTSNPPETVTFTNNQGSSITLGTLLGSSSVGTTTSHSKDFFIENDNCSGATLSSGADCTFDVRFLPWSLGAKSGNITVPSNAPGQPYELTLNGNSIPGSQLLQNRSFDNYSAATGLPNLWLKNPGFKIGIDGVDDSWAFHGPYSVKLVGDGDLKILSQLVDKSGSPGDDFSFFVTTRAIGIPDDSNRWLMQVMFYNGNTIVENRNVKLKTGTYDFKRITQTYTATTNYTHIMFRIHFGKSSGTAWVDLSSLQWAP